LSDIAKELDRVAEVCAGLRFASCDDGIEDGVLEPLAGLLGADSAVFRVFSPAEPSCKPVRVVSLGIGAAVNESYLAHYYALDPVRRWLRGRLPESPVRRAAGHWRRMNERSVVGDDEEFPRDRREFLVPNGFIQHVGFCIWRRDDAWLFDVHRAGATMFGVVERARARLAAQFLQAMSASVGQFGRPNANATPIQVLSEREAEVADAVALGLSNKQVAAALGISVRTVENHLRSVYDKLQVATRTHLVAKLHQTRSPAQGDDTD
jgi:DNA-binding CsgD family transcriptional regulator